MEGLRSLVAIVGRLCLAAIFLLGAFANLIPNFDSVAQDMQSRGLPAPPLILLCGIAFLVFGGALLALGYKARFGALLLLLFLIPFTYYFHAPWTAADEAEFSQRLLHFLKNLGLAGALLLIIASGPGPGSVDERNPY